MNDPASDRPGTYCDRNQDMSAEENRRKKAIDNLLAFLDYMEWIGRIPSTKSDDAFERRWAFWLIHMKQSRRGSGTCIWYPEYDEAASSRGMEGLFVKDTRLMRAFEFSGKKVMGMTVDERISERSRWNQSMYMCSDGSDVSYKTTVYEVVRMISSADWFSVARNCSSLVGERLGCWTLMGYHGLSGTIGTEWFANRFDGKVNVVGKICFPSIDEIRRFVGVSNGVPVGRNMILGDGADDMIGRIVGNWTVVGFHGKVQRDENAGCFGNQECLWDCVCKCGNIRTIPGASLRHGRSSSCGCCGRIIRSRFNALEVVAG